MMLNKIKEELFIDFVGITSEIKGLLGFCQCYKCKKRAVAKIDLACSWGTEQMKVCEDCYLKFCIKR